MMMTPKVTNKNQITMRERLAVEKRVGNGERDRERVDATNAGEGQEKRRLPLWRRVALSQARADPARDIGRRKHPDEARRDGDQRGPGGRDHQFADREGVTLLDQRARLQPGEQEHQTLDEIDDQIPEKDSLQPRRGGDQPRPDPADVEPAGDGRQHAGAAEMRRHPEGEIGRQQ